MVGLALELSCWQCYLRYKEVHILSSFVIILYKKERNKKILSVEINMAHQLGISIKYLKQTIHLNPVHQCNIKRNLTDQVSTVHIN